MTELINNPYFILLLGLLIFSFVYLTWKPEGIPAFLFLLISGLGAFYGAANLPKIAFLKGVLLPILLVMALISKVMRGEKFPFSGYLLVIAYAISVCISCMVNSTDLNDYRASLGVLLIPLVVALCPKNKNTVKYFTVAVAAWGMANMLMVVATWWGLGWARAYSAGNALHTSHRAQGLMGHSTAMGVYFAVSLIAAQVLFYRAKGRIMQGVLLLCWISMVIGLIGTLSRGALLAWFLSALYTQYRVRGMKLGTLFAIGALALVVLGGASLLNLDSMMLDRFTEMRVDPSARERLPLLEMGKKLFEINPLMGVGLGQQGIKHLEAHNTYMQVLMENGIVGFSLFLLVISSVLWRLRKGMVQEERENEEVAQEDVEDYGGGGWVPALGPPFLEEEPGHGRSGRAAALTAQGCYYAGLYAMMGAILVDAFSHVFDYLLPLWVIVGIGLMA